MLGAQLQKRGGFNYAGVANRRNRQTTGIRKRYDYAIGWGLIWRGLGGFRFRSDGIPPLVDDH